MALAELLQVVHGMVAMEHSEWVEILIWFIAVQVVVVAAAHKQASSEVPARAWNRGMFVYLRLHATLVISCGHLH